MVWRHYGDDPTYLTNLPYSNQLRMGSVEWGRSCDDVRDQRRTWNFGHGQAIWYLVGAILAEM